MRELDEELLREALAMVAAGRRAQGAERIVSPAVWKALVELEEPKERFMGPLGRKGPTKVPQGTGKSPTGKRS